MCGEGWEVKIRVWVDWPAAGAVAGRLGLGWARHIEVRLLWLEEVVRQRRFEHCKIRGDLNPSDALTKPKTRTELMEVPGLVNVRLVAS